MHSMNHEKRPNILVINGSPHQKGNTAILMKWITAGCKKNDASVKWIHLSNMNISYCQGCHTCLKTGNCKINDDVSLIYDKIQKSDGVIIGSPVYEGHTSAQLKTLLDRFALFSLYMGCFDSLWSMGVATSGIAPAKATAKECIDLFGKKTGVCTKKTATFSGGYQRITDDSYHQLKQKAEKQGKAFVQKIKKNPTFHLGALKHAWIVFLRKHFLKKLIMNNSEEFAGVLTNWKEKGWIKEKNG